MSVAVIGMDREYPITLDHDVRLMVRFKTKPVPRSKKREVESFHTGLEVKESDEWKTVTGYDNCHGGTVHKHLYLPDGTKGPGIPLPDLENLAAGKARIELEKYLRKEYQKELEWYTARKKLTRKKRR